MTSSSYIKIVCAEEADPESNRIMLRTTPPTFIELQPGENILTVETYPDLKYGFYPEQRRSDSISINDSCQSIIEVDLSHFDASEVQSTSSMFDDLSA